MTKTQRVILDSFYRYTGTNNKPKYIFPNVGISAETVHVNSIGIPHSFYNITSSNNVFAWVDSLGASQNSTIAPGNYTISELITSLSSEMTSDASDTLTYTVTSNANTKKISITNSGPTNFSIRPASAGTLRGLLGFRDSVETSDQFNGDSFRQSGLLSGASSYTAVDSYFIGVKGIYVRSNLFSNTRGYSSTIFGQQFVAISTGRKDYISFIPVTGSYGDLIKWDVGNEAVKMTVANNITDLDFELIDEYGRPIDLNGRSWVIELVFETHSKC